MPREKLAFHKNDIIRNYAEGESAASIGRRLGVTTTTITRILKGAGVMPSLARGESKRRADEFQLIAQFNAGVAPAEICRDFGVSKSGLYAILNRAGVELRGHIGGPLSDDALESMMRGREDAGRCNENEQLFRDLLAESGFETRPQVALGTGVIDFVIPSHAVAVEINLRGTFSRYVSEGWFVQRIKDCAHRGWHFYVFGGRDTSDITHEAMKDIVAWLHFLRQSPASRRQYRVVWGGSELLATGCSDDDQITIPLPSSRATQVSNRKGERR